MYYMLLDVLIASIDSILVYISFKRYIERYSSLSFCKYIFIYSFNVTLYTQTLKRVSRFDERGRFDKRLARTMRARSHAI